MDPVVKALKTYTTAELDAMERGEDPQQVGVAIGKTPPGQPTFSERVSGPKPDARQKLIEEVSSPMERGLAGYDATMRQLLTQTPETPEEKLLGKTTAGSVGMAGPAAIGSVLGGTKVAGQAAYGAVTGASKPGTPMERAGNAAKEAMLQAMGQSLTKGLVKGANATAGDLTREGQVAAAAKPAGIDLSAGDITNNRLLRLMEEKSIRSPSRNQATQVGEVMTAPQGDPITKAVTDAYESAQAKVSQAAQGVDAAIAANPKMPKLVPRETVQTLRDIINRHPETLNNIDDQILQNKIIGMVGGNAGQVPRGISFAEMDEIRRALGPVVAKIQRQAQSPSSNITTATANRWNSLYGSIINDMDNWGAKGAVPQEVLDLHNTMKETFKSEVLPLREHPIAGKLLDGNYDRPEEIIRDLTAPRNRSIVNDLYEKLDQGGKNAFDAFRLAQQGSREFVKGESGSAWPKPLALATAAALPAVAYAVPKLAITSAPMIAALGAAEQGVVHGLNTRLGKAMLSGSPEISKNPFLNRALYAAPRQSMITSGLEALRSENKP